MSRYEQAIMEMVTNPDRIDPDPGRVESDFSAIAEAQACGYASSSRFAEEGDGRLVTAYGRRGTA
jgi:hypothetical protein